MIWLPDRIIKRSFSLTSITQVAQAMQTVFTEYADKAGRETGFVKRESKMGGAEFAQTLSFGWLSNPAATLEELAQTAATIGVKISAQGLDQRFTEEGARLLKRILDQAVTQLIQGETPGLPILKRFSAVYIQDSSVVDLPEDLTKVWSGCGNGVGTGQAAVKIEVRLDLLSGEMIGPFLEDGRIHDAVSHIQSVPTPARSLRIADLGYWSLDEMDEIAKAGGFWLSRLKSRIKVALPGGKSQDILEFLNHSNCNSLDCPVIVSDLHPTPARLLAIRVPQEVAEQRRRKVREDAIRRQKAVSKRSLALADWTILVTNVPDNLLSLAEALVIMRARWQIELLFKLWKSYGQIDEWRSSKPWRILCEVYAKLLAMLIQHWLFLVGFWQFANRSWVKATQTIRKHALHLSSAFANLASLETAIHVVKRCLEAGCRINKRKTDLRSFQLLESLSDDALA
jgi:hypothetical protein